MKSVVYFVPETFEAEQREFSDFHYDLQQKLREAAIQEFGDGACVSPVIASADGKKLMFGVMRDRHNGELVAEKYKITIETTNEDV